MKAGRLRQFLHQSAGLFGQPKAGYQRNGAPWPTLGIINVILTKPKGDTGTCSGVMSVVSGPNLEDKSQARKKAKVMVVPILVFSEKDKEGTF